MRKSWRFPAILAAFATSLLCVAMLGSPAMAATTSVAATAATAYYEISSASSPYGCLQENGTTSGVYLGSCSTNHSDYWYAPSGDTYEIANLHSNLCLSVTGTDAGVYLNTCSPGATAQEWLSVSDSFGRGIYNAHSNYYLWQSGATGIQQRNSFDPSSVHDSWNLTSVS